MNCDCESYGQFCIIDQCDDENNNIITCKCKKVKIQIHSPTKNKYYNYYYYNHPKVKLKSITKQLIEYTIILIIVMIFILYMSI